MRRAAPVTGSGRAPPTDARQRDVERVEEALYELALEAIAKGGVAPDSGATPDEQIATMRGEAWWLS